MTITVENLSKKYIINHQAQAHYQTLRDKLAQTAKRLITFGRSNPTYKSQEYFALKDVSFEVKPGDRVAIIGPNGAGKSTLLKVLSRITPPTKGRVTIHGKRVSSLLEVGTGFHPELTGRENIFLNGSVMGMSHAEIKRKFDQIVEFADIEQFLDTPVKRYSSGMYVRLAFAVSAHLEPDILIIDEVLAVGDARFQKKCIGQMEKVAKDGRTVLFVTHNMSTLGFCNKGLLLDKGRLIPTDSLQDCIQKYHATHQESGSSWSGDVGNDHVRIKSFRIINENESALCPKSGKAQVETIFDVHTTVPDLVLGYFGFNKFGTNLVHYKMNHREQSVFKIEPGTYTAITEIDFSIFSEGLFRLELDIGIHNVQRISTPEIHLQFEVFDEQKKYGEPENTISPPWTSLLIRHT